MTVNFRFSDEHFPSNGKPPPVYFDWDKERQKAWWLESDQRKEQDGGTNTSSLADEIEAAKRQHRQRARGGNGTGNDDAGPQGKPGHADETVVSFDRYERRNKSSNGNGRGDSDERPVIQLSTDLHADLIACERELISSSLEVYQRAGNIVRRGTAKGKAHTGEAVVFDRITHHNPNSLRTVLAKTIVFEGWNEKKKKFVLRHPPKDYAGCLLDHPDKNYPILHGLISAPTLRADGSILDVSGAGHCGLVHIRGTRQAITGRARWGRPIVALDNQNSDEALTSDALSQMLTQPIVKVRPFGQNKEMLEYPSMSVISVTGNNLPGSRKFTFNPIVMARQNRVRLVRACIIILRAYVVAGRPPQDFNPMGGFEDWSEWVRSAIVWLGRADPCATMSVVRSKDQGRGIFGLR